MKRELSAIDWNVARSVVRSAVKGIDAHLPTAIATRIVDRIQREAGRHSTKLFDALIALWADYSEMQKSDPDLPAEMERCEKEGFASWGRRRKRRQRFVQRGEPRQGPADQGGVS